MGAAPLSAVFPGSMPTASRAISQRPPAPAETTEGAARPQIVIRRSEAPPDPPPKNPHLRALSLDDDEARDHALVMLATRGDHDALTKLLTIHQDRVFAVCVRMCGDRSLAEDLAQETLLRVIRNLSQFNFESRFTTWLTRIAINVCLTHFRRDRLRRTVSLDRFGDSDGSAGSGASGAWTALNGGTGMFRSFAGLVGRALGFADSTLNGAGRGSGAFVRYGGSTQGEPDSADRAERSESMARLRIALSRIDAEQRAILILRDMHGLDYSRIAEILDVAEGTVKSRLFRARAALRDEFEKTTPEQDTNDIA